MLDIIPKIALIQITHNDLTPHFGVFFYSINLSSGFQGYSVINRIVLRVADVVSRALISVSPKAWRA